VGFVVTELAEGDLVGAAVDGPYEGSIDGASDEHGLLVPAVVPDEERVGSWLEVGDWALQQQEKQQLPSLLLHAADVTHEQSQVQPNDSCYD